MKIKLHFNRVNMAQKKDEVWSAHTYTSCNMSKEVLIKHRGKVIGKTVFNPEARQPRAYIEFFGNVEHKDGEVSINIDE